MLWYGLKGFVIKENVMENGVCVYSFKFFSIV